MRMYEVTYIRTGSGETKKYGRVCISTCDKLKNGKLIGNISDVIEAFEEIAEDWGSYENRNAIVNIEMFYEA